MKKFLLLTFAACTILSCTFAQTPDEFSFKKTYKVNTPADMSIKTNDGFIKAYSGNSNEIQVYFIVKKNNRLQDISLDELEDHLEVDIISSGSSLEISIRQEEKDWFRDWKDRYHVSMQIIAPKNTECNLHTSDGNIELTDFIGDQSCRTSDGDIQVEDISGSLSARTSDGNIEIHNIKGVTELQTSDGDIRVANIIGDCKARTSDGNITARDVEGDVETVTSDGNINLENLDGDHSARTSDGNIVFEDLIGGLTAQTSDGDIRGEFKNLNMKLALKTSDGNISVTVPDGLAMDILLRGEDIHTKLNAFSGDTSDHKVEGTIRGGGVDVELVTSDGDVSLNYR